MQQNFTKNTFFKFAPERWWTVLLYKGAFSVFGAMDSHQHQPFSLSQEKHHPHYLTFDLEPQGRAWQVVPTQGSNPGVGQVLKKINSNLI